MKIHLLFKDSFIQGIDILINELLLKYNLQKIDLGEIYRDAIISKSLIAVDVDSISDTKVNLLFSKLAENRDVLIVGFNFDSKQVQGIFSELSKNNCKIENIWYFQSINVLKNLKKVEKYKIMAEREDPTFAHINKIIIESQFSNLNMIKLIDKYDKLSIYNIESYGEEGKNSIVSVIKELQMI
jgi:hypothetical protein